MIRRVAVAAVLSLGLCSDVGADERIPNYDRIRRALQRPAMRPVFPTGHIVAIRTELARQQSAPKQRDSVWNGALIGAGIGAGGGYIWAQRICGGDDAECLVISAPVGVLAGAGIGLAVGAVVDALHK